MGSLWVRAGRQAYDIIKQGGFSLDRIGAYLGPAVGPRWLLASGFDLALLKGEFLGRRRPLWLIGASAGAWRFAAWLQPEPVKSYEALREAYIEASYSRTDTPEAILQKLRGIIDAYIEDDALPFALASKRYRLAVMTCRARHLLAAERGWLQKAGLGLCFAANAFHPALMRAFVQRVVFYYGPKPPDFCLRKGFGGVHVPLSEVNFKAALLASGAVPAVVAGVRDIFEAPDGVYRDGGLMDYHVNQDYSAAGGLTLLFHHQERIIPGWMDRGFDRRRPSGEELASVVMVYPSEEFIARLPGGKVPDRADLTAFLDDPAARIERWRRAVALAEPLGEEFLELVASGRLKDVVEELPGR